MNEKDIDLFFWVNKKIKILQDQISKNNTLAYKISKGSRLTSFKEVKNYLIEHGFVTKEFYENYSKINEKDHLG